jgi:hypothetical protein
VELVILKAVSDVEVAELLAALFVEEGEARPQ